MPFFDTENDPSKNQSANPQIVGVTTPEQFKTQTGATQPTQPTQIGGGGVQTAAPSGAASNTQPKAAVPANAGANAQATAPVDFGSWLGANQQGAQNQTNQLTGSATSAEAGLNSANSAFSNYTNSALSSTPSATAFTSSPSTTVDQVNQATTSSYGGPTASSLSNATQYAAVLAANKKAQAAGTALQNNGTQSNGWDAAAAQAYTPGKQQVLGAEQSLGNTQSSTSQNTQQTLGQATGAQNQWNNTVSNNLAAIGGVASSTASVAASTASSAQSTATTAAADFGKATTAPQLDQTIAQYTPFLLSLGISQHDIDATLNAVNQHGYNPQQAAAWIEQAINSAATTPSAITGYDANSAAVENAANAKLGNGTTVSTGSVTYSAPVEHQEQQNEMAAKSVDKNTINALNKEAGKGTHHTFGGIGGYDAQAYAPIDNIVGYLTNNGLSLDQVGRELGLSPEATAGLVAHYSGHANALQRTYGTEAGTDYSAPQPTKLPVGHLNPVAAPTKLHF